MIFQEFERFMDLGKIETVIRTALETIFHREFQEVKGMIQDFQQLQSDIPKLKRWGILLIVMSVLSVSLSAISLVLLLMR